MSATTFGITPPIPSPARKRKIPNSIGLLANAPRKVKPLKIASTAASRWFTEPFIQSNAVIVAALSNDLGAGSPEGYASCCEALAKADLREKLESIYVPLLVIAGRKDPVTTVSDAQYMVNHIRSSALFEIDASHISNIEQPKAFNQAILDFIA